MTGRSRKHNDPSFAAQSIPEGQSVKLPHTWNQADGQGGSESYYRGKCWYQREADNIRGRFDETVIPGIRAAGNIGQVYINGSLSGESRCGYAMFRVALNPYLKAGENLIAVMVDNSYDNEVLPLLVISLSTEVCTGK